MATNVRFNRLAVLILLLAGLLSSGPAARGGDWMPMLPNQDFYDFQLFAPPDLQDYEIYPEPSEGIYFNYDRLYWGITPPRVNGVGRTGVGNYLMPTQPISPQTIVQLNNSAIAASGTGGNIIGGLYTFGADPLQLDLNTSWMRTKMSWGNRYEGGWIYDNSGVAINYFDTGKQSQNYQTNSEFAAASPTQVFTQTTTSGGGTTGGGGGVGNINQPLVTTTITAVSPPPDHIISQKLVQQSTTQIQSVGVAAIIRRELGRRGSGSTVKFGLGPRFLQFADRYNLGYESNQYAFNRGPTGTTGGATGGAAGGAGGAAGGATGGAAGGGATGGGAAGGGATGGGATGGGATGGAGGGGQTTIGGAGGIGGGNISGILTNNSAGDVLGITGEDTLTGRGLGSPLQAGAWDTYTSNNMIGPEFSLLFESHQGRWTFLSELKFTAGMNFQNNLYNGSNFPNSIGADYLRATFTPSVTQSSQGATGATANQGALTLAPPPLFLQLYGIGQSNATNAAEHRFVFSPIGEWRFGTQFRVSEAIRLHAGYTGMWMAGIARASTNTGYRTDKKMVQYARQNTTGQPVKDPLNPDGAQVQPGYWYVDQKPVDFNRIGPVSGGTEYVFTNGLDFGIEVRY